MRKLIDGIFGLCGGVARQRVVQRASRCVALVVLCAAVGISGGCGGGTFGTGIRGSGYAGRIPKSGVQYVELHGRLQNHMNQPIAGVVFEIETKKMTEHATTDEKGEFITTIVFDRGDSVIFRARGLGTYVEQVPPLDTRWAGIAFSSHPKHGLSSTGMMDITP
jgi:hypothetical protein